MNIFTLRLRTLALSAAVAVVGAVLLSGCTPDDEGGGGGGAANNCGVDGTAGSCKSVVIGGQRWMAQNLNYQTGNSWCYNNNNSNCNKYGRLYDWETAKAACQSVGWRVPTDDEWWALSDAAVGVSVPGGGNLKAKSGWGESYNGTDNYGFAGLPGGYRNSDGSFEDEGRSGWWWSNTEVGGYVGDKPRVWGLIYAFTSLQVEYDEKSAAYSVRCVQ